MDNRDIGQSDTLDIGNEATALTSNAGENNIKQTIISCILILFQTYKANQSYLDAEKESQESTNSPAGCLDTNSFAVQ